MKAFDSSTIETDKKFVEPILPEPEVQEKMQDADKQFVKRILQELEILEKMKDAGEENAWRGEAWAEFVDRYAKKVFERATKWTRLDSYYRRERKRRIVIHREAQEYSDTTLDAFIWIFEHLKFKLRYYEKAEAKHLDAFVAGMLQLKNLRNDYLDWRKGYLPKALEKCPKEEKQIFLDLLAKMPADQIAQARTRESVYKVDQQTGKATLKKEKEPFTVDDALHAEELIHAQLKQAGQEQRIFGPAEIPLSTGEEGMAAPEEITAEEHVLLQMVKERFTAALNQLSWNEVLLLRLFYQEGFSVEEILAAYEQVDLALPTIQKPIASAKPRDAYKALERTRARLLELFRDECQDLPTANITNDVILMLLKLLGVIL